MSRGRGNRRLIDHDEVAVHIAATPLEESDGPELADEILAAIGAVTRDDDAESTSRRHGENGSEPAADGAARDRANG